MNPGAKRERAGGAEKILRISWPSNEPRCEEREREREREKERKKEK